MMRVGIFGAMVLSGSNAYLLPDENAGHFVYADTRIADPRYARSAEDLVCVLDKGPIVYPPMNNVSQFNVKHIYLTQTGITAFLHIFAHTFWIIHGSYPIVINRHPHQIQGLLLTWCNPRIPEISCQKCMAGLQTFQFARSRIEMQIQRDRMQAGILYLP